MRFSSSGVKSSDWELLSVLDCPAGAAADDFDSVGDVDFFASERVESEGLDATGVSVGFCSAADVAAAASLE